MLFIDQVKIIVKAGQGGNGCQSFFQNRYSRYPKPDGGDGGKGADIIIKADGSLFTLLDFKYKSDFKAGRGAHGSSKQKKGKDACPLVINVPTGTVVSQAGTGCILKDLDVDGACLVVAKGGCGGAGNRRKKEATSGAPGEEKHLILDLKAIADVGLVGFPNVGKSTLISAISSAQPKIAAYPFTTKSPILGVVKRGEFSFVVADIPGLVQGSHKGRGLGDRFLRHIERTRLIVHLIDIAGPEGRSALDDYTQINQELKFYSQGLAIKPQIVAANKIDLDNASENLKNFRRQVKKKVFPISALEKTGLEELVSEIIKKLQKNSN